MAMLNGPEVAVWMPLASITAIQACGARKVLRSRLAVVSGQTAASAMQASPEQAGPNAKASKAPTWSGVGAEVIWML